MKNFRSLDTTDSHTMHGSSVGDMEEQERLLGILFYTVTHFFGDISKMFSRITDPRNPKKVTYSVNALTFTVDPDDFKALSCKYPDECPCIEPRKPAHS